MVATKKAILTCVVLVGILLYGCGCDAPVTPTPTPGSPSTSTATAEGNIGGDGSTAVATNSLPSGPAALLLNKATDAMHEAKSFQYMIVGSMYPGDATPTADEMQNTDVSQFPSERPLTEEEIERLIKVMGPTLLYTGEGAYVSPDRARYKVTPNLPPEVNTSDYEFPIIVVGDRIFLYNSFENHYMVYMVENSGGDFLDFALSGNLSNITVGSGLGLFDTYGTPSFKGVAKSAVIKGEEALDAIAVVHVDFFIQAQHLEEHALGEVWIEKETNRVRRLRITGVRKSAITSGPETTIITISYSGFGEEVSPAIEKPANVVTQPTMAP